MAVYLYIGAGAWSSGSKRGAAILRIAMGGSFLLSVGLELSIVLVKVAGDGE